MGGIARVRLAAAAAFGRARASLSDRSAGIEPVRVALMSWWLAMMAIWIVQQAHDGQHERHELPPLLHLFRDAALAVPLAALAVLIASVVLAPRLTRFSEGSRDGLPDGERLRWVGLVLVIFGALTIPGHELHGALFGVEASEVGWFMHALLDVSITAIGACFALFPVAIVVGPPVRRSRPDADHADESAATHLIPATIARSTR